jgi:hypothetical protein
MRNDIFAVMDNTGILDLRSRGVNRKCPTTNPIVEAPAKDAAA